MNDDNSVGPHVLPMLEPCIRFWMSHVQGRSKNKKILPAIVYRSSPRPGTVRYTREWDEERNPCARGDQKSKGIRRSDTWKLN
jgi:hypothetical protein